jgi:hypothetical protein
MSRGRGDGRALFFCAATTALLQSNIERAVPKLTADYRGDTSFSRQLTPSDMPARQALGDHRQEKIGSFWG